MKHFKINDNLTIYLLIIQTGRRRQYFIFKVDILQLALRKHKRIVDFGLMHLAATNLCVWFRYLVTEVAESVHEADEVEGHISTEAIYFGGINERNIFRNLFWLLKTTKINRYLPA